MLQLRLFSDKPDTFITDHNIRNTCLYTWRQFNKKTRAMVLSPEEYKQLAPYTDKKNMSTMPMLRPWINILRKTTIPFPTHSNANDTLDTNLYRRYFGFLFVAAFSRNVHR